MLVLSGPEWKKIRSLFNPGFAAPHLNTLIPMIMDDVLIIHTILGELADKGEVIQIEEPLTRLTVDIMGHVILEHDLNSQRSENELVNAFRSAVVWTPSATETHPILNQNPRRKFWYWWYARKMDNYLKKVIQDRIEKRTDEEKDEKKSRKRPTVDLAIDEYVLVEGNGAISNEFQQVAIDQIKTFLFAGHETSSSTMCFIYHLLSLHPEAMAKFREEHDEVFGDIEATPDKLTNDSKVLNELPYTTAVIKETLRLFTSRLHRPRRPSRPHTDLQRDLPPNSRFHDLDKQPHHAPRPPPHSQIQTPPALSVSSHQPSLGTQSLFNPNPPSPPTPIIPLKRTSRMHRTRICDAGVEDNHGVDG